MNSADPDLVLQTLARSRILPVLVADDAEVGPALAGALVAGGLRLAEVTLRTPIALDLLRAMSGREGLLVGAGTVLSVEQAEAALAAGATFVVSPGFDARIVELCQRRGVAVFPGVATATELQAAVGSGLRVVKLWPVEPLGGVKMLDLLAGPFPHVRFNPSGGVDESTAPAYLAHPSVLAVGGSWMASRSLIAARAWDEVTAIAARAVALAAEAGPAVPPA